MSLSVADIETILDTLIYDGKVERWVTGGVPAATDDATQPAKLYRALPRLTRPTGLMCTPCGVCPVSRGGGTVQSVEATVNSIQLTLLQINYIHNLSNQNLKTKTGIHYTYSKLLQCCHGGKINTLSLRTIPCRITLLNFITLVIKLYTCFLIQVLHVGYNTSR